MPSLSRRTFFQALCPQYINLHIKCLSAGVPFHRPRKVRRRNDTVIYGFTHTLYPAAALERHAASVVISATKRYAGRMHPLHINSYMKRITGRRTFSPAYWGP